VTLPLRDPDPAPDQIGDRGDVELCRACRRRTRQQVPVFLLPLPPRFSIAILALVQFMSVQMNNPGFWRRHRACRGLFVSLEPRLNVRRVEHARLILIDPEPAALDPVQVRIRETPPSRTAGIQTWMNLKVVVRACP